MEGVRSTSESIRKTSRSSSMIRSNLNKWPGVATVEKDKALRLPVKKKKKNLRQMSYGKSGAKQYSVLPPFSCGVRKVTTLLH